MENKQESLKRVGYRVKALHRIGCAPPDDFFPWGESSPGVAVCQNSLYSKRSTEGGVKLESLKVVWDRVKALHRTSREFCGKSLLDIAAECQKSFYSESSKEDMTLESLGRVCRRTGAFHGTGCEICGEGMELEWLVRVLGPARVLYRTGCAICGDTWLACRDSFFSESSMEGMKLDSLERVCDHAEARHRTGYSTSDNWFTWGEALLGIAECQNSLYSKRLFIDDAIQKLRFGLFLDVSDPRGNWCLGKAYVACGLSSPDLELARKHFRMATEFLENAVSLKPCNKKYRRSLHLPLEAAKGPNGIFEDRDLDSWLGSIIMTLSFLGLFVACAATITLCCYDEFMVDEVRRSYRE